jgi:hypothetical protein
VVSSLNIGNRQIPTKLTNDQKSNIGNIIHEDVINQKILSNGELYTCKLIKKKIGSSLAILHSIGLTPPTATVVVEHSIVDKHSQTSWQETSNVWKEIYFGKGEREWLYLTETAIYINRTNQPSVTDIFKKAVSRSYISGIWATWPASIHSIMKNKGISRWQKAETNQSTRLQQSIEKKLNSN